MFKSSKTGKNKPPKALETQQTNQTSNSASDKSTDSKSDAEASIVISPKIPKIQQAEKTTGSTKTNPVKSDVEAINKTTENLISTKQPEALNKVIDENLKTTESAGNEVKLAPKPTEDHQAEVLNKTIDENLQTTESAGNEAKLAPKPTKDNQAEVLNKTIDENLQTTDSAGNEAKLTPKPNKDHQAEDDWSSVKSFDLTSDESIFKSKEKKSGAMRLKNMFRTSTRKGSKDKKMSESSPDVSVMGSNADNESEASTLKPKKKNPILRAFSKSKKDDKKMVGSKSVQDLASVGDSQSESSTTSKKSRKSFFGIGKKKKSS